MSSCVVEHNTFESNMIKYETINDAGRRLADKIRKGNLCFDGEAIVFIGALGICVRKILPIVKDKHTDPAVVCVDSTGKYVIPVLSGHVGGANGLAREIAKVINAEAIITTQSDNTGLWSLDTIAKRFGWQITKMTNEEMNKVIATFVNKCPTALVCEVDDEGTRYLKSSCPTHVTVYDSYNDYLSDGNSNDKTTGNDKWNKELLILVSPHRYDISRVKHIQYCPQCLNLGIGCQKDAPTGIANEILSNVRNEGYAMERDRKSVV